MYNNHVADYPGEMMNNQQMQDELLTELLARITALINKVEAEIKSCGGTR